MTECIDCGANLNLDNVEDGEIVTCRECGIELEVRSLDPIRVEVAPQEEEDWGQ